MDRADAGRAALNDPDQVFIGVDVGTSGIRSVAIDQQRNWLASARRSLPTPDSPHPGWHEQDPEIWWATLYAVLGDLARGLGERAVCALAIDGTSGTVLVTDGAGHALGPALMYKDQRALAQVASLQGFAPADTPVHSASASLPKLLWLLERHPAAAHALHQSEWLSARLTQHFDLGDENNQLKMGYEPVTRSWPGWIDELPGVAHCLPTVGQAGNELGRMDPQLAESLRLRGSPRVMLGTTDSTASLVAALPRIEPGAAVTALGSTLVVKIVSAQPVNAPEYGVYSHRLGDHWLVGGASNCGGAILAHYFGSDELAERSRFIDTSSRTGLDYYPLVEPGERFPINDPALPPSIAPIPQDRTRFLQGLLEGIGEVEALGYERLRELGAGYPSHVLTTGGGADNSAWTELRSARLGVPVEPAARTEAAYGSALLAAGLHLD